MERGGSASPIRTVTICGSLRPICGSLITVGLRLGLGLGSELKLGLGLRLEFGFGVRVADWFCCIQTAGESDKMRINYVIKTDQWRSAPRVVSL